MRIESVKRVGCVWGTTWSVISTSEGEYKIEYRKYHVLEVVAERYVGMDAPDVLASLIKRAAQEQKGASPFLPMRTVRPARGEVSTTGLFETHWKSVPLDLVIFEDRWEISLREEKEYHSGYYSYSRISLTSVLEVRDRETGAVSIARERITPDDDGPNLFDRHLGNEVLAMRVGRDGIVVKTRFGRSTKNHHFCMRLRPPASLSLGALTQA